MSGKHPFSMLKGRSTSSSGPAISFRFSRVDEELEEVSSGKKLEAISEHKNGFDGSRGSISSKSVSPTEDDSVEDNTPPNKEREVEKSKSDVIHKESNGSFESTEDAGSDRDSVRSSQIESKEPAAKDSVKDYLSRFGRRAASLDSDSSSSETEVWPFLKDLKGRIAKNIEDKISKDVVVEGEIPESASYPELKGTSPDPGQDIKVISPPLSISSDAAAAAATSGSGDDDHLSPSFEATENLEVQKLFEKFLHENRSPSSEQKSPISEQRPSSQPSSIARQRLLPQVRKRGLERPEFNMTLSSLMASRSFSFEDVKADVKVNAQQNAPLKLAPSPGHEPKTISNAADADDRESINSTSSISDNKKLIVLHKLSLNYFKALSWNSTMSFIVLVCFALIMSPVPSALSGFLIGCIVAASICYSILQPPQPKEPFRMPDYENMPPLVIEKSSLLNDIIYKGWMNELPLEYNPDTYHVNCTNSVYIRLDGSYLRVSHPKTNIPKRAMFNEPRHELAFVYQRHYDVTGASVALLPEGLFKKRLWSKKYPICITIPDPKQSSDGTAAEEKESSSTTRTRRPSSGSKDSSPARRFEPKPNENGEVILYLFARTDREKYDWYHRFLKSSRSKILKSYSPASTPNISSLDSQFLDNKRTVSLDLGSLQQSSSLGNIFAVGDHELEPGDDEAFTEVKFDKHCKFEYYMTRLLSNVPGSSVHSRRGTFTKESSDSVDCKPAKPASQTAQNFAWLNALIGRLFFDFLTEDIWAAVVAERIQRKLSKLKLPNFIEELKVTDIHLGSALPKIHRASNPVMDDRGMWIDIDISYNGSFQMTLETKLNLLKLQRRDDGSAGVLLSPESKTKEMDEIPIGSRIYDSEEDDSAESSSDEDVPLPEIADAAEESTSPMLHGGGGSAGKKLIRLVDKIAQSSYFQTAAKNKYIKRAMEEVSNMPLMLTVEVHWLIGTLAINIPAMPTDRLWYGFRKNPQLSIVARPKLGCRAVRLTHVTEWIEKKLVLEFQKVLVMPNMDDLIIPIMKSDIESAKT